MKGILKYFLFCSVSFALLSSCVEDQDFGQFDQIELTPTYEASMLYIEAPETLVNDAPTNIVFTQNFNFDAFSSDVFADRVLDGTVTYIIENTTSKELSIIVEFLDAEGNVLDIENFDIDPAPTATLQRDIAYGDTGRSIEIIKNLSSIRVSTVNESDNNSTSNQADAKIILKSSGKFRVQLK